MTVTNGILGPVPADGTEGPMKALMDAAGIDENCEISSYVDNGQLYVVYSKDT